MVPLVPAIEGTGEATGEQIPGHAIPFGRLILSASDPRAVGLPAIEKRVFNPEVLPHESKEEPSPGRKRREKGRSGASRKGATPEGPCRGLRENPPAWRPGLMSAAEEHYVAVAPQRCSRRAVGGSFLQCVYRADWMPWSNGLKQCGVTTAAMESNRRPTGYRLFQKLAQAGIEGVLANAAHVRNVPGAQVTDVEGLPMAARAAQLRTGERFLSARR